MRERTGDSLKWPKENKDAMLPRVLSFDEIWFMPRSLSPYLPPFLPSSGSMRVARWLPEHIDPKITSKRLAD